MTISLYKVSAPIFVQFLTSLSATLDKAQAFADAKKIDPSVLLNTRLAGMRAFDPFPYGLLTMIVSLEAIFLSTFVLISQNRLSREAEYRADLDMHIRLYKQAVTRALPTWGVPDELASEIPSFFERLLSAGGSLSPAELGRIVKLPEVQEKYASLGVSPEHSTPAYVLERAKAEGPRIAAVLKAAGMEPE